MAIRGILLNSLGQLARRKLVLSGAVISLLFLVLFSWPLFRARDALEHDVTASGFASSGDAALVAMVSSFPMAAIVIVGISVIINSSLLPEEISSGRMSFWCAHPVSRFSVFAGTILSSLAITSLLALFLLGGIVVLTSIAFPFRPAGIVQALGAFVFWVILPWSVVTLMSMYMRRMAAIVISFGLYAAASFLGGLGQLGRFLQGTSEKANDLITAGDIGTILFPVDGAFRAMQYGLRPVSAVMSEPLAFFGAVEAPDPWKVLYGVLWVSVVLYLAWRKFRSIDLP